MTKKTAKMLLAAEDVYGPIIKFAPVIYRLTDTSIQLSKQNHKEWKSVRSSYSDEFLNAMFVVQIYEQKLPPVDPQPQEENV